MNTFTNSKILSLVDLTSLNLDDNNDAIEKLCTSAISPLGEVAAVCIYPQFIPFAKTLLSKNIYVATVINFPDGSKDLGRTLKELELSIKNGADEIDLVMPYSEIINGDYKFVENFVTEVKKNCDGKLLKVIIESGVLASEDLIRTASKISISAGSNFIKTSTGKVEVNATLEATKYMIEEIKISGTKCGFKAAGGIKTVEEALKYLDFATNLMGKEFIKKETFRFGASSLLDDLLGKNSQSNVQY
jgi:deoxyribose-phosphate aldolase